ncbi:ribonuclease H-like domain-containing protein [Tanacetum coccineum]
MYDSPLSHPGSTIVPSNENEGEHSQGTVVVAALKHQPWVDAMNAEMEAFYKNNTWELTELPKDGKAIGNVNNAFLYGDLNEDLYMALPPGKSDYNLFTKSCKYIVVALLVYVDDIIITGNSLVKIEKFKQFLKSKFMIKDLGKLKYFLGIGVLEIPGGVCLNQRKYCLELIDEFGFLASKPSYIHMQPNIALSSEPKDDDPLLENVTDYQKLIGKLIYLTTTRSDIAYIVSCLSQFMHSPLKSHLKTALKVIRYLKGSPGKGINVSKHSASGIGLKAYSDVGLDVLILEEAEYRALASVTSEVIWILKILKDLNSFSSLGRSREVFLLTLVCGSRDALPSLVVPLVHLSLPLVSLFFQPRTYNLSTLPFRDSVQIVENDLVVKKFPENDLDVKKFPKNDFERPQTTVVDTATVADHSRNVADRQRRSRPQPGPQPTKAIVAPHHTKDQNAANRAKNTILTHQGKKSFAQGRNEYKVQKGHYEDLIETWRKTHSRPETGEFKTEKNRKRYLDMKSMQDQLPGGGSTSRRRDGPQAFQIAISREELGSDIEAKDQEGRVVKEANRGGAATGLFGCIEG